MTRKIVTVLGARPQFIKAAAVSRRLREQNLLREILVHTGQHHDQNMSDVFFAELGIPTPDYNLGIAGGSHGQMTGRQMEKLEEVLLEEKPDWVLVYGDTNTTLAGALTAAKMNIPLAHVEAGLRSFNRRMPEEINRVVTDHVSDLLFSPTETATKNLLSEGISDRNIDQVGDVMMDVCLHYRHKATAPTWFDAYGLRPGNFILATVHRAENTEDSRRLSHITTALGRADYPVVLPLHPRTRKALERHQINLPGNIYVVDPVGYLEMLWLTDHAAIVTTDSGGLQKEAYFMHTPCITLRDETEWLELAELGVNRVVGTDPDKILAAIHQPISEQSFLVSRPYGDGHSAEKIIQQLSDRASF